MINSREINNILQGGLPITKEDLINEAKLDTKTYTVQGKYKFSKKNRNLNDILDDLRGLPKVVVVSTEPIPKEDQPSKDGQIGSIRIKITDEFETGVTDRKKLISGVLNQANNLPGVVKIDIDPQQMATVLPDEETRGR